MREHFRTAAILTITLAAASCSTTDAPAGPASIVNVSAPRATNVSITGLSNFFQRGQTAQLTAVVALSNGFTENRTGGAQWQSANAGVASVNSSGVVSAGDEGEATIRATSDGVTGEYVVRVRYGSRTADPAPGQQLPLPNIQGALQQFAGERPDLLAQSCPDGIKYGPPNAWLNHMVDRLRTLDTRWGYNAKPTRTAADNNGRPVVAAGDEIAYNYSADPDEGTTKVYLIDILESHCGTPRLTYRHFTGEEPGRWTGAGRF